MHFHTYDGDVTKYFHQNAPRRYKPGSTYCLTFMEKHTAHTKTVTRLLRVNKEKDEDSPLMTATQEPCVLLNSPTVHRLMTSRPKDVCPLKVQSNYPTVKINLGCFTVG